MQLNTKAGAEHIASSVWVESCGRYFTAITPASIEFFRHSKKQKQPCIGTRPNNLRGDDPHIGRAADREAIAPVDVFGGGGIDFSNSNFDSGDQVRPFGHWIGLDWPSWPCCRWRNGTEPEPFPLVPRVKSDTDHGFVTISAVRDLAAVAVRPERKFPIGVTQIVGEGRSEVVFGSYS